MWIMIIRIWRIKINNKGEGGSKQNNNINKFFNE